MEKQIWVIREKKTKARGNNRKRPSLIQRKNENSARLPFFTPFEKGAAGFTDQVQHLR
jgi:hypothetical protein